MSATKKTTAMRLWELENGVLLEDFLTQHFDQGGNKTTAAHAIGKSLPTLLEWLDRLGAHVQYTIQFPLRENQSNRSLVLTSLASE